MANGGLIYVLISGLFGFVLSYLLGIGKGKNKAEEKAEQTIIEAENKVVLAEAKVEQSNIEKKIMSEAVKISMSEPPKKLTITNASDIKGAVSKILEDSAKKAEEARKRYENK